MSGIIAALAFGAVLTGCSAIKLAYNNLPEVAYWWLDGYVDFSGAQTPKSKDDLTALLAWHRETELPKIVAVLQKAEALAPNDITSAQACELVADVRTRLVAAAERAEAPGAALAVTLSEAQLQTLARKYAKNDAEYVKDWVERTPAQQQEKRYDKFLEQNEDFYGRLDNDQRDLLNRLTAQSMFDAKRVDAERRKRQQEALVLLRRFNAERTSAADAQPVIQAYVHRIAEPRPGAWRDYQQGMLEEGCRYVATLHNATRPEQRQKAVQRLRAYQTDLRDLAAR
ncbi:DUF6279 family lipoprotein [Variovorax sp. RTB1]|uniref:DUF6279 family lipoprotein n=1 Tax=Variovorax sp. RTB1 TaxID=3048631 RepID=UPI002B228E99|nr:DUF6279 family lipoprotein [Variovorax sp. RTB1]MEB0110255.1 DUF6279 family lipoprotein [Variovorax sp. RTB1]